jgi:hypothetical protein
MPSLGEEEALDPLVLRCSSGLFQLNSAFVAFIAVSRPGYQFRIPEGARVEWLEKLDLPVSSSDLRAALACGARPEEIPEPVLESISRAPSRAGEGVNHTVGIPIRPPLATCARWGGAGVLGAHARER